MIVKRYVIKLENNNYYSLPWGVNDITRALLFDDFQYANDISMRIDGSEVIEVVQIVFSLGEING